MNTYYEDIIEKLGSPLWWDDVAVPRYCEFDPSKLNNIYQDEACLLRVECQACGQPFDVAVAGRSSSMADMIRAGTLHYGDPPNNRCCPAGPTMSSETRKVLQYWRRIRAGAWVRYYEFEVDIEEID